MVAAIKEVASQPEAPIQVNSKHYIFATTASIRNSFCTPAHNRGIHKSRHRWITSMNAYRDSPKSKAQPSSRLESPIPPVD